MINQDKWIGSIKTNNKINEEINKLDPNQWINTIPKPPKVANKKNTYNSITKYSLAVILFISGLVLVSGVKDSGPEKNFLIPAVSKIGNLLIAEAK